MRRSYEAENYQHTICQLYHPSQGFLSPYARNEGSSPPEQKSYEHDNHLKRQRHTFFVTITCDEPCNSQHHPRQLDLRPRRAGN
jgi:hypothetical protein